MNAGRIDERIAALARVSAPGDGVTRVAYSSLERDAHALVADWAVADGAEAHADPAGNTVLTYATGDPYLLLGSHVDSVPHGGRFDGVAGVVVALEVAAALSESLDGGLRVVVFAAEEGARFGIPCLGSSLVAGAGDPRALIELRDAEGVSVLQAAGEVGLAPESAEPWVREPAVTAFLEVHIEQGAVLEREGVRLGIVDVVAGCSRFGLTVRGRAEHSGTAPMRGRADALAAAAEIVLAVEAAGGGERQGVATVGRLDVRPNSATTVPGEVRLVVDLRDVDAAGQQRLEARVRAAIDDVAARRGVDVRVGPASRREPVMLSAWPREALADACRDAQVPFRIMPSGAGHDAAVLAEVVPAGMLFVATPGGRSHVPDEQCRTEDLVLAAGMLADAVRRLDRQAHATVAGIGR